MKILITGGAGFVGASLGLAFRTQFPQAHIVALDNLRRRGSEMALPLLKSAGITFCHGDVRDPADLESLDGNFDLVLEAAAEPSVQTGMDGLAGPAYVTATNLGGALNCLEFLRRRGGAIVFLSTSRVYAIEALRSLQLMETQGRFSLAAAQQQAGVSPLGINEDFSTQGAKSFYGASKLAAELFVQEYAAAYNLPAAILRCGVIAGPGQWGKTDQGVFTYWVTSHFWRQELRYTGFGGTGHQVRDLLHPRDLFALVSDHWPHLQPGCTQLFNVGGGTQGAVSLREWTQLCRDATGRETNVAAAEGTHSVDVPFYVSDNSRATAATGWQPTIAPRQIAMEIADWVKGNQDVLQTYFT